MSRVKKLLLLIGDVAILYIALVLAVLSRYGSEDFMYRLDAHILPFSVIFLFWLLSFYLSDLYEDRSLRNKGSILQSLTWSVLVSGVVSVMLFYLFGDFFRLTPKTNLLVFAMLFLGIDYFWRVLLAKTFSSGAWGIGIFGSSPLIEKTVKYLHEHPHVGYKVIEWKKEVGENDFKEMANFIKDNKIQFLIVQTHLAKDPKIINATYRLLPLQANIMSFSAFYEGLFGKVPMDELEERWFVENIATRKKAYDGMKNILDLALASTIGIIFLPVIILFTIILKTTSSGPAIFVQKRVGRNGKIFTLYKFRTMHSGAEGPLWTEKNDDRITPFGRFMRFTHLDELPQLWNILRGEISITGPRPERVELVEQYQKLPYYEIRHIVKPGLSGWAQINFRPSASIEEAKEKLEYDVFYVKNRSFILDALIILKTLRHIFTGTK